MTFLVTQTASKAWLAQPVAPEYSLAQQGNDQRTPAAVVAVLT